MSTSTAQALRDMAEAARLIAAASRALAGDDVPAGHAAYFAFLTEHLGQQLTRAQILAADALRRTGAHKLDRASFQAITDAGTSPTMDQIETAQGRTTTGRTHFKSARGLMHDWLDIPRGTAGSRMVQADCLVGGVDDAGHPIEAWLPELAEQFADPVVDPRLVAAAALKLHSARKDLGEGPAGEEKKDELQAESVAFLRSEPKSARKHISDLIAQVKAGKRPLKALLDGVGIFKKGMRKGLMHYAIHALPSQAVVIDAFMAGLDNPATLAGNREALRDAEAQFIGAQSTVWDDEASKPDWAKDDDQVGTPSDDIMTDDESTGNESPPADSASSPCHEPHPEMSADSDSALPPWEDLNPERRRLVGFLALLMTDRTRSDGSPDKQPELVAPQVSIILSWEKMQQQTNDFAVASNGIALSPAEARTALCNAGVYPVVLNGKSLPLDLGRTQRLYSKAQRRAIRAAYRGCSYPGCSMPVERCEIDHLDPWEKGGSTDINSADLNCLIHHTARHCGLFHAVKIPGSRPMVLLSPELDPEQKLRLNTYFLTPQEALEAEEIADRMTAKWRAGDLDVEIVDP